MTVEDPRCAAHELSRARRSQAAMLEVDPAARNERERNDRALHAGQAYLEGQPAQLIFLDVGYV
jgi:hypothetical protein